MRVRRGLFLALLPLCGCAAHTAVTPTPSGARTAAPAPKAAPSAGAQELIQARDLMVQSQWEQADALLRDVVGAEKFRQLNARGQHIALELAAEAALRLNEPERALSLVRAACDMSDADSSDWVLRLNSALAANESQEAVFALTTLAQRWPQELGRTQDTDLFIYTMRALDEIDSEPERYQLLSALHRVAFTSEPEGASCWWRDLALLQLARGERASALQTLARASDPYVVISIRADKRFDALREELAERLTLAAATQQSIEDALRATQLNPNRLQPMIRLAELLVASLRLQQALHVTDAAIERQDVHGSKAWSDYEQEYTVILTIRADALYELGRWQAAVAQLEAASRLKSADVGNIIDLAKLYNTLGRSREARETLQRDSAEDTSQFGHMQFEKQTLWAAVELHEPSKAERALAYLREHRGDAPSAYQEALLIAHRPNAGAALLISRLADPKQRSAALLAVQYYTENAASPQMVELQRRWRALLARHDVQQVITRVGRVDHYPLMRDDY